MPAVRRQHAIDDPADWITVDAAATLTGKSVRRWQQIAIRESGRGLAHKAAPPSGNGKPVWWVHRSLDGTLGRYPQAKTREERVREALLAKYPWHAVENAYKKADWLGAWRKLIAHSRLTEQQAADAIIEEARQDAGEDFKVSFRSLKAWRKAYCTLGADGQILAVEGLIDRRSAPNREEALEGRSPEAVAFFYSLFHSQTPFSAKVCHLATCDEARRQRWSWPAGYAATTRWLREHDNLAETCLLRDGGGAYSHKYMPHLQTDWDAIQPGEMYVCDHTQCDFWVAYRDKQIRPWLTAVQDMRTRSIVGWHLGPAPHSEAIATAFRAAFRDWSIPGHLRIDNGKDFASKWLAGLTKAEVRALRREFGQRWKDVLREKRENAIDADPRWGGLVHELGIELIYAIPYAAWSKGTIERFFGRFHDQCGKTFVTYCGNSPLTRPECLQAILKGKGRRRHTADKDTLDLVDSSDIPTLDEARARVADYIDLYHHSEHRGDGMDGRTPLQVWATATGLRKADPEALAFLCSIRGEYKVGGNGVSVTVAGKRFSYGSTCHKLRRYAGRKVLVGVDPQYPAECFAFEVNSRRLIARLEPNKRIHPCATTDDVREAVAEIQRERKGQRAAQRTAARRTRTATERINAHVREKLACCKATGTEDSRPTASITVSRTGFEGCSTPARNEAVQPVDTDDLSVLFLPPAPDVPEDDGDLSELFESTPSVDRKARDLSTAKAALWGHSLAPRSPRRRRRVNDDVLRGKAVKDDDGEDGKDAGHSSTDLLRMIGGKVR